MRPHSSANWHRPTRPGRPARVRGRRTAFHRLNLEALEDRVTPSVVDLGPLRFSSDAFTHTGNDYAATGTIALGLVPSAGENFKPLLDVSGSVAFTTGAADATFSVNGDVQAQVGTLPALDLWSGNRTFDANQLVNQGLSLLDGKSITAAGVTFTLDDVRLANPGGGSTADAAIRLQGGLSIPELAGLTITVDGSNFVVIDETGVSLTGVDATINGTFAAHGVTVTAKSLTVSYTQANDEFDLFGGLSASATGIAFDGTFGNAAASPPVPGLVVQNGALQSLAVTVGNTVTLPGLTLSAAGVHVTYSRSADDFEIASGSVAVSATDFSLSGSFGNAGGAKGLVIQNGTLQNLDVTISGNAQAAGVTLGVSGLELTYDHSQQLYEVVSGSVSVSAGSAVSFSGTFGDATTSPATPGLVVQNGTLQSVNVTVSGKITAAGLAVQADGLHFVYQRSAAQYQIVSGSVSVSAGSAFSFSGAFGDATTSPATPGLVVQAGVLQSVNIAVSGNITAAGLTVKADGVHFLYDQASGTYEVASGSVTVSAGSAVSFSGAFGDATTTPATPGLVIQNGGLQSLDITVSGNISAAGLIVGADGLHLVYVQATDEFEILSGTVSVSAGSAVSFTGSFGDGTTTPVTPGLVIQHGTLQSVDIAISGSITAAGLSISANGLYLVYQQAGALYEIASGSVSVSAGTAFSFSGAFGDATTSPATPGLVIVNGSLQSLDITVSGNISAAGVMVSAAGLHFTYDQAGNQFTIAAGTVTVTAGSAVSFTGTFGSGTTPGLVVQGGQLQSLDVTITGNVTAAGLTLTATGLDFTYDRAAGQFEVVSGSVSVSTSGFSFSGAFGNQTTSPPTPGLVVLNGDLASLDVTVNGNLSVAGLTCTVTDVTFLYNHAASQFEIDGGTVGVTVGSDISFTGTFASPGLVITGGALTALDVTINTKIVAGGLEFDTTNLEFQYQSAGGGQFAIAQGSATLSVDGNTISVIFGNSGSKGLVVQNGALVSLDVAVTTNLSIDGLELDIPAANPLELQYMAATADEPSRYELSGTVSVKTVFNATVTIGTAQQPGIVIQNGHFFLDQFLLTIDNVELGAFTLKELQISFSDTSCPDCGAGASTELRATVDIAFPAGWDVQGTIIFCDGALHEISIGVHGVSIAVGPTGLIITDMDATIDNLDEASNLVVSGDITARYGPSLSLFGQTVSAFIATGSFTVDKDGLVIKGNAYFGAYVDSSGTINGVLGNGSINVDLNWAKGDYNANAHLSFYGGVFVIDAAFKLNSNGDVGLFASADVQVPSGVPLIGGTELFGMSVIFVYRHDGTGVVGAWISTFLGDGGFALDLPGFSNFRLIGSGGVSDLESQFNQISGGGAAIPLFQTLGPLVQLPAGPVPDSVSLSVDTSQASPAFIPESSYLVVQLDYTPPGGTAQHYVFVPFDPSDPDDDGSYVNFVTALVENDPVLEQAVANGTTSVLPYTYGGLQLETSASSLTKEVVVFTPSQFVYLSQGGSVSNLQLDLVTLSALTSTPLTFDATFSYDTPTVSIDPLPAQVDPGNFLQVSATTTVSPSLASTATVSFYVDTAGTGYHGILFADNIPAQSGSEVVKLDMHALAYQPYYVYAVIRDGINSPVFSDYSSAVLPNPPLFGQVQNALTGAPLRGFRAYLDLNGNGQADAGEPASVTSATGYYQFYQGDLNQLGAGSSPNVQLVVPSGYQLPTPPAGVAGTINFAVYQLASITGTIQLDDQELDAGTGLSGLEAYLDLNDNGSLDTNEPTAVTDSHGQYIFFNVPVPSAHAVRLYLPPVVPVSQTANQVTAGTAGNARWGGTLGMQFDVVNEIRINTLGVFVNDPARGPQSTLFAAIFSRDPDVGTTDQHTPLAMLEFDPGETDLVVAGGSVFKTLGTPLRLPAGFHGVIAAWGYQSENQASGRELYGDAGAGTPAWNLAPWKGLVSFLGPVYANESDPAGSFPTLPGNGSPNEYAAGTFQFEPSLQISNFVPATTPSTSAWAGTLGMQFDVNSDVLVTSLGVYVDPRVISDFVLGNIPGLFQPFSAAVFSRDPDPGTTDQHTPLVTLTFNTGDPNLVQVGSTVYLALSTPLLLPAGFHGVIAAWGYSASSSFFQIQQYADAGTGAPTWTLSTGDGLVTPLRPVTGPESTPGAYPTTVGGGAPNEYAAASFRFAAPSYYQVEPTSADDPGPAVFGPADTYLLVTRDFTVGAYLSLDGSVQNTGGTPANGLRATRAEVRAPAGPAAGQTVTLLLDGKVVGTTTLDANGNYHLAGLKPGKYTVQETVPQGFREASALHPDQAFLTPKLADLFAGKPYQALSAVPVDLNDDGKLDLAAVVVDPTSGAPLLVVSPGTGATFGLPAFTYHLTPGPLKVTALDLDGDGKLDLAVLHQNGTIDVFSNRGRLQFLPAPGTFTLAGVVGRHVTAVDFAAGDFDQTGKNGVAVAYTVSASGPHGVVIFRAGKTPLNLALPHAPGPLLVGDVNRDGTPDVVVNEGTALAIAYNAPRTHTFQVRSVATDLTGPAGPLALDDINGDNRPDLIVAAGGHVEYFRQNIGNFSGIDLHLGGATVLGLAANDFNADGQPDVAVLLAGGKLALFLDHAGTGLAKDERPRLVDLRTADTGLISSDVNADGHADLVLLSGHGVYVLGNQVTLTAAAQTVVLGKSKQAGLDFVNVRTGLLSGLVYHDADRNGGRDAADKGLAGVRVFLDVAGTGVYDPTADPSTTTGRLGEYSLNTTRAGLPLPNGTYRVGVVPVAGLVPAGDGRLRTVTVVGGRPVGGIDFGLADDLLAPVAGERVRQGKSLSLNVHAVHADADHRLTFHLDAGGLGGTSIDPYSGRVQVNVPLNQPTDTYTVTVRGTDPFDPMHTDAESFSVTVQAAPNAVFVRALYRTVLGRAADLGGLTLWVGRLDGGTTRLQVAASFWRAPEHRGLQVDQYYVQFFHRPADPVGRATWAGALLAGVGETEVEHRFLTAAEYTRSHPDAGSFVRGLYADVLGRPATPGEVAPWVALGHVRPASYRDDLARLFLAAPEAAGRVVDRLHTTLLGRPADAAGRQSWVDALVSGRSSLEQAGEAFLVSDEFFRHASVR